MKKYDGNPPNTYYGPDDMTYNMYLHKSEQYVEAFDYDMENQTLLDVIEMHNVLKHLPATTIANDDAEVDTFKKGGKGDNRFLCVAKRIGRIEH